MTSLMTSPGNKIGQILKLIYLRQYLIYSVDQILKMSEMHMAVIMFSPCVFVCLCVVVYVCHDVCPDDLTMKDWCHTNNILQVHCWGCLVVQVIFRALMTSSMTSQDHKVGQILKLIYLRQYLSYSVDQKLKLSEMLMAIFLVYSTSGITSGKKVCRGL